MLFVATTPSSTLKANWSALLERALQRCDAASVRDHLSVRGGQGRCRGQGRDGRRQRAAVQLCGDPVVQDWMAAALLPDAVTCVPSVTSPLSNVAGDRSFKHVYICFRRRLSPVAKASAKELTASYSAQSGLRPFGGWYVGRTNPSQASPSWKTLKVCRLQERPLPASSDFLESEGA